MSHSKQFNISSINKMKFLVVMIIILIGVVKESEGIMCYHCNSEYDPRCGDPFNPFSLGTVNCSVASRPEHIDEEPTLCRKISQKVYGQVRVVRGCGYITDERDNKECQKRSGTHDVFAVYCACTTDLCNSSNKLLHGHLVTFATLLLPLGSLVNYAGKMLS